MELCHKCPTPSSCERHGCPIDRSPAAFITKTSDKKAVFETGAHRDTAEGKLRYSLIPLDALKRVAALYSRGAALYGERNWEKGMPKDRLIDSALRHIFQGIEGQTDEDHWAAAIWNIMAIIHFEENPYE